MPFSAGRAYSYVNSNSAAMMLKPAPALNNTDAHVFCYAQAAEEEEAAEQLLLQQQQTLRSKGSKGMGAFQPWRGGGQGGPAEGRQDPSAGSPDNTAKSLGFDLRPQVHTLLTVLFIGTS